MTQPVDVLRAQCTQLLELVDGFSAEEWQRPTRCPPMTVKELVVHCAKAAEMTELLAATDMVGSETNVDRARWWVSPNRRPPGDILAEAQAAAAEADVDAAAAMLRRNVAGMLERFGSLPPDAVVGNEWRTILAAELAGSRVLELGVHTMDLGHATQRGERILPDAAAFVADILRTLLGASLPDGLGWDDRTLILTGTGRRPLSHNERFVLGPLAERFPLLR